MVEPDRGAIMLADEMMDRDDIMRTILSETIESSSDGKPSESGRTYCQSWGSILPPSSAGPASIQLQTCLSGPVGIWHTHPGARGVTDPVNSLPDMANVVFESVDVSIVPGAENADIMVAPADAEAAQDAFRQAVGADLRSAGDVRDAINARRLDPVSSRARAREALSGLLVEAETGYSDINPPTKSVVASQHGAGGQAVCACSTEPKTSAPTRASECLETTEREFEAAASNISERVDKLEIGSIAISAAVGNVVGEVVNRVLFD
jgi:hypothetical protein